MIPGLQAGRHDVDHRRPLHEARALQRRCLFRADPLRRRSFAGQEGQPAELKSYKDIADNPDAKIGAPGGGTEEKLALEAGVPRDRVIVVPDGQSGIKMLQDGRIDVYSLPVLSIHDLMSQGQRSEP